MKQHTYRALLARCREESMKESKVQKLAMAAADVVRGIIRFVLEVVTIGTEALKIAATHLDDALDEFKARMTDGPAK